MRSFWVCKNINFSLLLTQCLCYSVLAAEGLKFYDIEEGKGPVATEGSTAQVSLANDSHFNFSISKSSSRFYNVMVSVFSTFRCILIAVTEASLQFLPENPSF